MATGKTEITELLEEYDFLTIHRLIFGGKRLDLFVYPNNHADMFLRRTEGLRLTGATTALYQRAKEKLQQHSNETGRPIMYEFCTKNPKMAFWALDPNKGRAIFTWEDEMTNHLGFYARTTIRPETR